MHLLPRLPVLPSCTCYTPAALHRSYYGLCKTRYAMMVKKAKIELMLEVESRRMELTVPTRLPFCYAMSGPRVCCAIPETDVGCLACAMQYPVLTKALRLPRICYAAVAYVLCRVRY